MPRGKRYSAGIIQTNLVTNAAGTVKGVREASNAYRGFSRTMQRQSREFSGISRRMVASAAAIGTALVAAFAVNRITSFVEAIGEAAIELERNAKTLGTTAAEAQALSRILQDVGERDPTGFLSRIAELSLDTLEGFNTIRDLEIRGIDSFIESFSRLRHPIDRLRELQRFLRTIDPDKARALLFALSGGEDATRAIPLLLGESIDKQIALAKAIGTATDAQVRQAAEVGRAINRIREAFKNLGTILVSELNLGPILNQLARIPEEFIKSLRGEQNALETIFAGFAQSLASIFIKVFSDIIIPAIRQILIEALQPLEDRSVIIRTVLDNLRQAAREQSNKLSGSSGQEEAVRSLERDAKRIRDEIAAVSQGYEDQIRAARVRAAAAREAGQVVRQELEAEKKKREELLAQEARIQERNAQTGGRRTFGSFFRSGNLEATQRDLRISESRIKSLQKSIVDSEKATADEQEKSINRLKQAREAALAPLREQLKLGEDNLKSARRAEIANLLLSKNKAAVDNEALDTGKKLEQSLKEQVRAQQNINRVQKANENIVNRQAAAQRTLTRQTERARRLQEEGSALRGMPGLPGVQFNAGIFMQTQDLKRLDRALVQANKNRKVSDEQLRTAKQRGREQENTTKNLREEYNLLLLARAALRPSPSSDLFPAQLTSGLKEATDEARKVREELNRIVFAINQINGEKLDVFEFEPADPGGDPYGLSRTESTVETIGEGLTKFRNALRDLNDDDLRFAGLTEFNEDSFDLTTGAVKELTEEQKELAKQAEEAARRIREAYQQIAFEITSSMSDAFHDIILGVKSIGDAFEELGTRIISSFVRRVTDSLADDIFGALFDNGGGGGFFGSILSSLGIPFLARGGSFGPGLAVVGEQGPELIYSGQRATVVPNGEFGNVVINNHVNVSGGASMAEVRTAMTQAYTASIRDANKAAPGVVLGSRRVRHHFA